MPWQFGNESLPVSKAKFLEELKQHPKITAVIAHDDLHAADVLDALRDAGYSVPRDMSLVSYDDTNPIIENRDNILTAVRLPLEETGYEGTKLLIRRILGEETQDREIILPVELMVRSSTAPPRKPKP